jgi:hypothetical protein
MSLGWSRFLLGIFAIQKVIRLPPFCPLRLRQRLVRHGHIAPLAGVTLAACLNAGTASALEFTFTFSGTGSPTSPATVTGLISGLLDNTNDQKIALRLPSLQPLILLPGVGPSTRQEAALELTSPVDLLYILIYSLMALVLLVF